jgi:hypothetical protein
MEPVMVGFSDVLAEPDARGAVPGCWGETGAVAKVVGLAAGALGWLGEIGLEGCSGLMGELTGTDGF